MTNESIWEKVDLIEKRFENRLDKSNAKFNTLNPVWDSEKETALNVFEMIDELNYLNDCCNNLIDDNTEYVAEINQMHKENEELKKKNKKQLTALKNLCEVEICEICEHQEYLTYETQDCIEHDSRCKKGFKEYNGKFYGIETLECDDFELRKELQRND